MMMVLLVVVLLAPASPGITIAVAPAAADAGRNKSKQQHQQQHHHRELESVIIIIIIITIIIITIIIIVVVIIIGDAANSATGTVCDVHIMQLLGVDVLAAWAAGTFSSLAAAVRHCALYHICSTMVVTGIKNSTILEIWYKAQCLTAAAGLKQVPAAQAASTSTHPTAAQVVDHKGVSEGRFPL